jgi:hypothetical protein
VIKEFILLENWSVTNFKSIQTTRVFKPDGSETNTLALKPLTVFCGANSSGKSSLLQSILLIAQTMRHRDKEYPIVLNGDYASLGTFDDVKTIDSKTGEIGICFAYKPVSRFSIYKDEYPFTHIFSENGKTRPKETFDEWREKLHKEVEGIEDEGGGVDETKRDETEQDEADSFHIDTISFELFFSPSNPKEKTILPPLKKVVFSVRLDQFKQKSNDENTKDAETGAYILKWHISKAGYQEGYDVKRTIESPDGTVTDLDGWEELLPFESFGPEDLRFQEKLPKQYTQTIGETKCVLNHFLPEEINQAISVEYYSFLH